MFDNRMMKGWGRWIIYTGYLMTVVFGLSLLTTGVLWGEEKPKVLRMALIPAEDIEEMIRAFEPSKRYLEKELGMKIDHFKATEYTAVVEAMRAKKIDVALYGPFSYVLAAKRAKAQAIVSGGDENGKLATYHSIFITHRDSGLRTMEDIKARANKLTVSFVDPASTSGHLIPRGHLESIGIRVDKDFKEIIFAGGHDASILAVKARKVDFGATWEGPYQRSMEKGLITSDDVFVVWKSEGIPRSPVAVRGDLDGSLVQKIQQAFLDMPHKAPEAFKAFEARWEKNKSYVKVTDKDYDYIRQVAKGLGKL